MSESYVYSGVKIVSDDSKPTKERRLTKSSIDKRMKDVFKKTGRSTQSVSLVEQTEVTDLSVKNNIVELRYAQNKAANSRFEEYKSFTQFRDEYVKKHMPEIKKDNEVWFKVSAVKKKSKNTKSKSKQKQKPKPSSVPKPKPSTVPQQNQNQNPTVQPQPQPSPVPQPKSDKEKLLEKIQNISGNEFNAIKKFFLTYYFYNENHVSHGIMWDTFWQEDDIDKFIDDVISKLTFEQINGIIEDQSPVDPIDIDYKALVVDPILNKEDVKEYFIKYFDCESNAKSFSQAAFNKWISELSKYKINAIIKELKEKQNPVTEKPQVEEKTPKAELMELIKRENSKERKNIKRFFRIYYVYNKNNVSSSNDGAYWKNEYFDKFVDEVIGELTHEEIKGIVDNLTPVSDVDKKYKKLVVDPILNDEKISIFFNNKFKEVEKQDKVDMVLYKKWISQLEEGRIKELMKEYNSQPKDPKEILIRQIKKDTPQRKSVKEFYKNYYYYNYNHKGTFGGYYWGESTYNFDQFITDVIAKLNADQIQDIISNQTPVEEIDIEYQKQVVKPIFENEEVLYWFYEHYKANVDKNGDEKEFYKWISNFPTENINFLLGEYRKKPQVVQEFENIITPNVESTFGFGDNDIDILLTKAIKEVNGNEKYRYDMKNDTIDGKDMFEAKTWWINNNVQNEILKSLTIIDGIATIDISQFFEDSWYDNDNKTYKSYNVFTVIMKFLSYIQDKNTHVKDDVMELYNLYMIKNDKMNLFLTLENEFRDEILPKIDPYNFSGTMLTLIVAYKLGYHDDYSYDETDVDSPKVTKTTEKEEDDFVVSSDEEEEFQDAMNIESIEKKEKVKVIDSGSSDEEEEFQYVESKSTDVDKPNQPINISEETSNDDTDKDKLSSDNSGEKNDVEAEDFPKGENDVRLYTTKNNNGDEYLSFYNTTSEKLEKYTGTVTFYQDSEGLEYKDGLPVILEENYDEQLPEYSNEEPIGELPDEVFESIANDIGEGPIGIAEVSGDDDDNGPIDTSEIPSVESESDGGSESEDDDGDEDDDDKVQKHSNELVKLILLNDDKTYTETSDKIVKLISNDLSYIVKSFKGLTTKAQKKNFSSHFIDFIKNGRINRNVLDDYYNNSEIEFNDLQNFSMILGQGGKGKKGDIKTRIENKLDELYKQE